ncbi:MAG: hypothetical protein KF901_22120, partial [Myxococcales bacterium]|nr:hypothetical protein [Myxococcales bacterium]
VGALSVREGAAAPPPAERLPGSLAAAVLAALGGARAVRVHDVAATAAALRFAHAVRTAGTTARDVERTEGGPPWR